MSKENAEQLLNSVMQDEKDVQDKVKNNRKLFRAVVWKKIGNNKVDDINFISNEKLIVLLMALIAYSTHALPTRCRLLLLLPM